VPLRAGSAYTLKLRLKDYWCPETKEFEVKLERKTYRVRAELIGKGAQHVNSDTQAVKANRFWIGKVRSDVAQFQVEALIRPARSDPQMARLTERKAIEIASSAMSGKFPESFKKHQPYRAQFTNGVGTCMARFQEADPGVLPKL